jgi:hypothetical protein
MPLWYRNLDATHSMCNLDELKYRLSHLFLDTDVSVYYPDIVDLAKELNISDAELKSILVNEVSPVVGSNVFATAGEWTPFDKEWFLSGLKKCKHRPIRAAIRKLFYRRYCKEILRDYFDKRKGLSRT